MAKQAQATNRMKVTISLSPLSMAKLNELAAANKRPPAVEAKAAVEFYLQNIETLQNAEWQSPIEKRLEKMENRLAGLTAKLIRATVQGLWFTTVPYTKGERPDKHKPLPDVAFQVMWDESRAFAASWLKKARLDEEQAEPAVKTASDGSDKK
jgi:hypothetical protein